MGGKLVSPAEVAAKQVEDVPAEVFGVVNDIIQERAVDGSVSIGRDLVEDALRAAGFGDWVSQIG
ncbi:MAG: hypothetical protein VXY56_08215 [Pseudomonadota bacterium]|nr:hypothetical protein [Pseudomonadota bacterium]